MSGPPPPPSTTPPPPPPPPPPPSTTPPPPPPPPPPSEPVDLGAILGRPVPPSLSIVPTNRAKPAKFNVRQIPGKPGPPTAPKAASSEKFEISQIVEGASSLRKRKEGEPKIWKVANGMECVEVVGDKPQPPNSFKEKSECETQVVMNKANYNLDVWLEAAMKAGLEGYAKVNKILENEEKKWAGPDGALWRMYNMFKIPPSHDMRDLHKLTDMMKASDELYNRSNDKERVDLREFEKTQWYLIRADPPYNGISKAEYLLNKISAPIADYEDKVNTNLTLIADMTKPFIISRNKLTPEQTINVVKEIQQMGVKPTLKVIARAYMTVTGLTEFGTLTLDKLDNDDPIETPSSSGPGISSAALASLEARINKRLDDLEALIKSGQMLPKNASDASAIATVIKEELPKGNGDLQAPILERRLAELETLMDRDNTDVRKTLMAILEKCAEDLLQMKDYIPEIELTHIERELEAARNAANVNVLTAFVISISQRLRLFLMRKVVADEIRNMPNMPEDTMKAVRSIMGKLGKGTESDYTARLQEIRELVSNSPTATAIANLVAIKNICCPPPIPCPPTTTYTPVVVTMPRPKIRCRYIFPDGNRCKNSVGPSGDRDRRLCYAHA